MLNNVHKARNLKLQMVMKISKKIVLKDYEYKITCNIKHKEFYTQDHYHIRSTKQVSKVKSKERETSGQKRQET